MCDQLGIVMIREQLRDRLGQGAAEAVIEVECRIDDDLAKLRRLDGPTHEGGNLHAVFRGESLGHGDLFFQAFRGVDIVPATCQGFAKGREYAIEGLAKHAGLVSEMPEDRRAAHPRQICDIADRGSLVTSRDEEFGGGCENPILCVGLVAAVLDAQRASVAPPRLPEANVARTTRPSPHQSLDPAASRVW